jgi:hypothetical protein
MIERLSAYLRQNLDSLGQPECIPFAKELEHTRIYTDIEQVRFDTIRVEYDVGDRDFSLPPLTLQPLVENAIRHGVRIREQGIVRIATRRTADCHEILVEDNGAGFDVESLEKSDDNHIGIRNVRERLEKMCGAVVAHNVISVFLINVQLDLLTDAQRALCHPELMSEFACNYLLDIKHLCLAAYGRYNSLIAYLSAAFCIERCFAADHIDFAAHTCVLDKLVIGSKVLDLGCAVERFIACEHCGEGLVHLMKYCFISAHIL